MAKLKPDGTFTEYTIPTMFSEAAGVITRYTVPTRMAGSVMAAEDAAGNAWFAAFMASKMGRLRVDRTFSEYPTPTPLSGPMGVGIDFNDGSVWFAETLPNKIGHLVPND